MAVCYWVSGSQTKQREKAYRKLKVPDQIISRGLNKGEERFEIGTRDSNVWTFGQERRHWTEL